MLIGLPENSHNSAGKATNKHSENLGVAAIDSTAAKKELVRFFYTTYFYPIKSTWTKAIETGKCRNFYRIKYNSIPETSAI